MLKCIIILFQIYFLSFWRSKTINTKNNLNFFFLRSPKQLVLKKNNFYFFGD